MKRFVIALMLMVLCSPLALLSSSPASAAGENMILNPSVESVDITSNLPANWQKSAWGSNTANFAWLTTGQDGSHSVRVTLSNYVSGDAKWFPDPVGVSAGMEYVFTDYYKSSVASSMVAAVQEHSGNTSYIWLADLPISTSWKKAVGRFTVPIGATQATVYHLISSNGWLTIDNAVIKPYVAEEATITNGVPNSSLEQVSELDGTTLGWQNGSWGRNSATFATLTTGHSGNRSAKVTLSNYVDGDAKWYFDPQPVVGGQLYRYSDWYQSNVDTHATVWVTKQDGSEQYLTLRGTPKSSTTWAAYSDIFEMPLGAISATVFHQVNANGWLKLDDVGLVPGTPPALNRALVSLTFDDGWASIHDNGLPILSAHHVLSTQYLVSSFLDNESDYMSSADVRDFVKAGHQIGSHTLTHPDLTTLRGVDLNRELRASKNKLSTFSPITDFASPYGAYNTTVLTAIKKFYRSHRSVDEGYNGRDMDRYNVKVQNIYSTTTTAEVAHWVQTAQATKTWLVLVYHQVDNSGQQYSVTPVDLDAQISAIQSAGLPVLTVDQALAEILPQQQ